MRSDSSGNAGNASYLALVAVKTSVHAVAERIRAKYKIVVTFSSLSIKTFAKLNCLQNFVAVDLIFKHVSCSQETVFN